MYVYEKCIFRGAELLLSTGVTNLMTVNKQFNDEALAAMNRFFNQDWGEVSPREAEENNARIRNHLDELEGIYSTCKGKLVIYAWGMADPTYSPGAYENVEVMLHSELMLLNTK